MGVIYKRYLIDKKLTQLEVQARNTKIGLWADTNPIPSLKYCNNK